MNGEMFLAISAAGWVVAGLGLAWLHTRGDGKRMKGRG